MSRDKVHILPVSRRRAPRDGLWSRVPMDALFLAALAVAFVLAHYSDQPPLVEKPISLERVDGPLIAENNLIGVRVLDSGLRVER